MAKAVEITFAIGAALTGGFTGAFGKAGQALSQLQKQASSMDKQSAQITQFQKMEESMKGNQAAMTQAREQAKALDSQIGTSAQRTAQLQSQYKSSQAEVERLNAVLVRNKDAYEAAKLKADSLKAQIQSSTGPTADLQRQYQAAQQEVRRLGDSVKQSATQLKAAKDASKQLGSEMKASSSQTKQLQRDQKELNTEANRLESGIKKDSEALEKMRSEMSAAGIDTKNLAQEQARLAQQSEKVAAAQTRLQNAQTRYKSLKDQLSWSNIKGDLISSAAIGYALQKPVKVAAEFEQAMAQTRAVAFTGAGKTLEQLAEDEKNFQALRKQALQLGRDTQFTAVQAANSQENLARAGFKTNEILASMPGLLNMAAAEGMDLATAADIAASTLRGFNMSADQMTHVADVLAQTSAASNTCITGLGESMKYVAPVASGLGISIEEVSAMLGVMGNAGIKGSEGGTALRGALLRLAQEPKSVANALADLGIKAKNAQGKLRELPDLMQELTKKMHGWGEGKQMQYLANIFGVRAASGMLAVMRGVADGSLKELERLDKESSGIMQAVVENINKSAGKILVSTDDMRAGMVKSEKQARRMGVSYDELQVYLGILAKQNIKGADADKVLTQAFTRLIKKPKELSRALKKYDISAFDKDGKLWGMPMLLRDLDKALQGMSNADQLKALEQIFGKGTGESMLAMMRETANGGFDAMMEQAQKTARGISAIMSETRNDTLEGDLVKLGSAWGNLQISIGDMFGPAARKGVQLLTDAISGLNKVIKDFPVASKSVAYFIGALGSIQVVSTVGKIGKALLKLPGAWFEVIGASAAAESALGNNATVIGKMFSVLGSPISGLKSAFKGLWGLIAAHPFLAIITAIELVYHNWDTLKELGITMWNKIKAAVDEFCKFWDSISFKNIFESIYDSAIAVIDKLKAPFVAFYNWLTGLFANMNPFNWSLPSWLGGSGGGKVQAGAVPQATQAAQIQQNPYGAAARGGKKGYHARAAGGILTRPEFALVAEAGAEAIIPLTDKKRGSALWFEAGRRLGMLDKIGLDKDSIPSMTNALKYKPNTDMKPENYNAPLGNISRQLGMLDKSGHDNDLIPSIMNALKFKPETDTEPESYSAPLRSISSQLGLLDKIGIGNDLISSMTNALISKPDTDIKPENYSSALGNISRQLGMLNTQPENSREGVPLWKAASDEVSFDRSVTNNNSTTNTTNNNANTMPAFAPVVNLTVNGGESGIDGKIRSALNDYFEEAFMSFQSRMERLAFS